MKFYKVFILLLFNVLLLNSCKENSNNQTSNSLDGVYEQIGYGRIVTITDGMFNLYDITTISCLPVMDGPISIFGDKLTLVKDTLNLKDGINAYKFIRLANTPELCGKALTEAKTKDPIYNFEVLAENFDQHYAYFELRDVNWDSLYGATKNKITSNTSDAELYRILEVMLDSFDDGHIGLDAPSEVEKAAEALITEHNSEDGKGQNEKNYGDLEIAKMVADHYLKDTIKSSRSELIRWGFMENDIGYLQINLMMGHGNISIADSLQGIPYLRSYFDALEDLETSEQHTKLEIEGIKTTLQKAMTDLDTSKALVLDVRFNGGGKDEVGMEIISNFNEKRRLVFSKKARLKNGYTPNNKVYLVASPQPYKKPVFILTSRESASATEIMILSSLLLENVYRIGNHTEGVFSDVMEKALPNGWEIGMSNEVYLDTKGTNYENIGIPPTVSLNYENDGQRFFRSIATNLESDKQNILKEIRKILNSN